jgi:hypothetical protein
MAAQPFFTLANEDNRGVYVPLNTMPANGVGDWLQGRISNKLGRVLELNSQGKVNQFAWVVDGTYQYFRTGRFRSPIPGTTRGTTHRIMAMWQTPQHWCCPLKTIRGT